MSNSEIMYEINMDTLIDYLIKHNWTKITTTEEGIRIFQFNNNDKLYEIQIPSSKDIPKYNEILYNSINTICNKDNLEEDLFIKYLTRNYNPIYAITCMTKFEELIINNKNSGFPDFGATAFMGFYHNFDDATESVIENACDINETCYDYAVIEEITPGLYSYPRYRWFYKFNRNKNEYEPIEEPKFMNHIANVL